MALAYGMENGKHAAVQNARTNWRSHQVLLEREKHILEILSISHWESFLEGCKIVTRNISSCSISTIEPLPNLHLGVFNLVKSARWDFFRRTGWHWILMGSCYKNTAGSMQNALFQAFNSILEAIGNEYHVSWSHGEFSKKRFETELIELFVAGRLWGMMEGKNYKNRAKEFPFLAGFIVRCIAWMGEASLRKCMCSIPS